MRVICGGQIVEDIDNYNRTHEMIHMMKPTEKRLNDAIEGFGDSEYQELNHDSVDSPSPIPKGHTQIVCFTPLSGLLSQDKFLPIRYCPIQLEFELVGTATDAVQGSASAALPFPGRSESFEISDVQLKCDLVQLDNSLDNEYASHLFYWKSRPINFSTFTCSSQVITSFDTSINVQRSFTRLKSVYVSLYTNSGSTSRREVNHFAHPMGSSQYNHSEELQFQVQMGSKMIPEYPIRSLAEAFYHLRKTLGINSTNAQMNMVQRYYRDHKFVLALQCEKMSGANFTGINTRAGELLTLRMKGANDNNIIMSTDTHKLHYVLNYDAALQINDGGVTVME